MPLHFATHDDVSMTYCTMHFMIMFLHRRSLHEPMKKLQREAMGIQPFTGARLRPRPSTS